MQTPVNLPASVIVLARVENTGMRLTGRHIRPDGVNWIEETECCSVAKALVWSRDMSELASAKRYAKTEGYKVLVLPDTDNVLSVARATVLPNEKQSNESK